MTFRWILAFLGALLPLQAAPDADLQGFALRCLQARARLGPVRILQFGDSHLAQPGLQRNFQEVFRTRFGAGGTGFCLPWVGPQPGLRAEASSGWRRLPKAADGAQAGLQNGWLEAVRTGETATLEGAFSHLRLHFQSLPGGGSVQIRVDGRLLEELSLQAPAPGLQLFERDLPNARRLEVRSSGTGPVRLLGVSLEEPAGAVHTVLAANGLQASWLLGVPDALFAAQVAAERPDLVILAFGTNEANDRLFTAESYRRDLETLLTRFRKAAPTAALALIGPPDAQLPRSLPGALDRVIEVQQALAMRWGAYFFDQREAMGGPGSVVEWGQLGLANRDRVHFTQEGYQRLAGAFLEAFFARLAPLAAACEPLKQDPRLGKAAEGAFQVPVRSVRQPTPPPPVQVASGARPIYVFKTRDGRTIITDEPANVAMEQGDWVGRSPQ